MQNFSLTCRILKTIDDQRIAKGPVLRPEVRDRQKSVVSAEEIQQAAHEFMIGLRKGETTSGYMHRDFHKADERFPIVESYITEVDMVVPRENRKLVSGESGEGDIIVPAGSWVMAFKVLDDQVWEQIVSGVTKGFSIGGTAEIVPED